MSVAAARVAAQAKINLWLRVFRPDATGYHPVDTLFARIALADDVTVRRTAGARTIDCDGPTMPPKGLGLPEHNLAWRAAELYASTGTWNGGFAIEITKRIPVGGGLGGGSADAGAVLRAMDALSDEPLGTDRLLALAATLGADVPFLAATDPFAVGRRYGDELSPVPPLPRRALRLVIPLVSVDTATAYRWLDTVGHLSTVRTSEPTEDWQAVARASSNDFESVVAARVPAIAKALADLRETPALITRMSGSGSTVFQVIDREPVPEELTPAGRATSDGLVTSTLARVAAVERIA